MILHPSSVDWSQPAPKSVDFDDVYFDAEDGLAETRAVFLAGIGAPDIWQDQSDFVVGETGFGTGLNFLATWQAWRASLTRGRLWYLAVEGFPLQPADIARLKTVFPELTPLVEALLGQYPPPEPGLHPMRFDDGRVQLLLALAPVTEALDMFETPADAWYLDGFAPARNPAMWTPEVFARLARLSRPGTRLATFTAAGAVRRGLKDAGFDMRKDTGFGRKRERLVGTFNSNGNGNSNDRKAEGPNGREWARRPSPVAGDVAVIGAGIAGAATAWALAGRGRKVTVFDDDAMPTTSDLPAALMVPRLTAGSGPYDRLQSASFLYAANIFDRLPPTGTTRWLGVRGGIDLASDSETAAHQAAILACRDWPPDLLCELSAQRASDKAGLPLPCGGLWIGRAGVVDSRSCRADLLAPARLVQARVTGLDRTEQGWRLTGDGGKTLGHFAAVVIAAGPATAGLIDGYDPPLRYKRGQIAHVDPERAPACAVQDQHYLTPAFGCDGGKAALLGATFSDWDNPADLNWANPRRDERADLLDAGESIFGHLRADTAGPDGHRDWSGLRVHLPDHLPIAGPLPDEDAYRKTYAAYRIDARTGGLGPPPNLPGLYVLAGLGSKGFQMAPLVGEYLATLIAGGPLPVEPQIAEALHPARFIIRAIKRGQDTRELGQRDEHD